MISQKLVRDPVKHLRWNFLQNIYLLKNINYFRKKLLTRCLTRFQIRHWMSLVIGKEGHLTLFRMGLFGAAKGWDRAKSLFPCLKSDTHIPQ